MKVQDEADDIVRERGAYEVRQFERPASVAAHEEGTGRELAWQSGGRIDAFCDFAGSGGTFAGVAKTLRAHDPSVRCYLVEPTGAAALADEAVTAPHHVIQGGGYGLGELPLLAGVRPDSHLTVTSEEAAQVAQRLAREEGMLVGYSAGANVAAALQLLAGPHRGGRVACVSCDSGTKYLSDRTLRDRAGRGHNPPRSFVSERVL